jgi:hypothetical protein
MRWSLAILGLLPLLATEARADGKETLEAARAAYYSLRREGLASFSCVVTPNWDSLLATQWRTHPASAAKTYRALSPLTFGVEAAPGQRARVMHAGLPASAETESAAFKAVVTGTEKALSGFFDTWTPFVMTSPIPPATAQVVEAHGAWSVDYKEGAIRVGLVMRKDHTIDLMRLATDSFDSVIQPQFTQSPKGLLLTAIQGEYKALPAGTPVTLQLRIEYQDVSGFQLPQRVYVLAQDGRQVVLMDLSFGTCQAQRR